MMTGALKELVEEAYKTECEKIKKDYNAHVKYIRIHPKWFHEVASCDKEGKYLKIDFRVQAHRLCDYPLIITLDVEKWTIDF